MKKVFNSAWYQSLKKQEILLILLIIQCCSPIKDSDNGESQIDLAENSITLTKTQFEASKMKLGKLSDEHFSRTVKVNGMLEVPPENKASISAYFGGYVKELSLLPGEFVKKGQILMTLENPDYVQLQQDFLKAQGKLKYLKSDYERQKSLNDDGIVSEKKYLKAESDYLLNIADYEALKKKLYLMNIDTAAVTNGNIRTTIGVKSPIEGYVAEVEASRGMFLNPGDVAVTIIDTDHLHIELKVFEENFSSIKEGQAIMFKLLSSPLKEYHASVYLVGKSIDPQKRIATIHGHLLNDKEAELFAPGMYVEADITIDSQTLPALPQDAVVSVNDSYYILVKRNSDTETITFEKKEVKVGQTENGFTQILNYGDLQGDVECLTAGAFNLIRR